MVDTNTFTVFGIPPYYFFAALGLLVAFGFFVLSISYSGKSVNGNAVIMLVSIIGLGLCAVGFSLLTKLFIAIYNHTSIKEALTSGFGLVFYGGLTGFLVTFLLLQKLVYKKIDLEVINIMSISIPLFHAFARVGCFFAGCCYGKQIDTFISVPYILYSTTDVVKIIPVQLMEAGFNLILFAFLFLLFKKHPKRCILKIYLFTYAIARFLLEFLRGDLARGDFGLLSFSQIYSILIIFVIVILEFKRGKKYEIV